MVSSSAQLLFTRYKHGVEVPTHLASSGLYAVGESQLLRCREIEGPTLEIPAVLLLPIHFLRRSRGVEWDLHLMAYLSDVPGPQEEKAGSLIPQAIVWLADISGVGQIPST